MSRFIRFAGVLVAVFGVCAVASAEELTKGTIRSVNADPAQITLKGIVKDTTYNLRKDANVWLDGRSSKLSDLRSDDQAVVAYDKNGDTYMAREVRALRNAKEVSGVVRGVSSDRREITLKGAVKDSTYEFNKNGTVWAGGKQRTLADVREGDEVLITYEKQGNQWVANDVTVVKRK